MREDDIAGCHEREARYNGPGFNLGCHTAEREANQTSSLTWTLGRAGSSSLRRCILPRRACPG